MNFTEKRFQFYTLKTKMMSLEVEKEKHISVQEFETVAKLRDQQRVYLDQINDLRAEMITLFEQKGYTSEDIKVKQEIHRFLTELDPFDHVFLDQLKEQISVSIENQQKEHEVDQQQLKDLHEKRKELLALRNEEGLRSIKEQIDALSEKLG